MIRGMEFVVFGVPGPQGSKTMMQHRTTGRHIMLESSAKVKPWRAAVKAAAELAVLDRQVAGSGPWNPIGDPVMLRVVFTLERPKSHFRTGRNAHLLKESAPGYPVSHQSGDLSKLVRATEDAVTDAGVWVDDSLVAETMSTKVYIGDEHPRALAEQGAWIQITSMSGEPST